MSIHSRLVGAISGVAFLFPITATQVASADKPKPAQEAPALSVVVNEITTKTKQGITELDQMKVEGALSADEYDFLKTATISMARLAVYGSCVARITPPAGYSALAVKDNAVRAKIDPAAGVEASYGFSYQVAGLEERIDASRFMHVEKGSKPSLSFPLHIGYFDPSHNAVMLGVVLWNASGDKPVPVQTETQGAKKEVFVKPGSAYIRSKIIPEAELKEPELTLYQQVQGCFGMAELHFPRQRKPQPTAPLMVPE